MVPQVSFGVQDSLGEISLSQLQKFLHQVAGGRNLGEKWAPRAASSSGLSPTPFFGQAALPAGGDHLSTTRQEVVGRDVFSLGGSRLLLLAGGHP